MTQRSISKSNPLSLAAAALITLWPSLAAAQNYTVRMKAADGTISTTYVSPTAVRNTSAELGQDIINRLDRGTIIYLDHKNKTYREVTVAEGRKAIANMAAEGSPTPEEQANMQRMGMNTPPQVTKLGAGETIAGYATERYSMKTPMMQMEVWMSPALQLPPAYYKEFNLLAGQSGALGNWGRIAEDMKIQGTILKRVVTMKALNKIVLSDVAASVEKGAVPPSTFEPPAGYKKVAAAQ